MNDKKFWEELIAYFPWYDTGHTRPTILLLLCVCIRYRSNVSTEPLPKNNRRIFTESLPSKDKGIFTEPLPINDREIHIQTHRLMRGIF
jgi:hypothetical protein